MTIKPEELIHLLGKSASDPEIERLKKKLGECEVSEFDEDFDYCFYKQGLALMFKAGILGTIQLFPEGRDGYTQYPSPIPHALHFSFKKADVRVAIGKPSESIEDEVEDADIFKFPDHVLSVSYGKKPETIVLLSFMTLKTFAAFSE